MAETNPPLYLDQDEAYGADELGLPYRDIMGEGVVGASDLLITAGTGLKSSVAKGAAWVKGDDDADKQPTYRVYNDAAVLLQHDAADATNPRIDLVIAQVQDATFSGVSKLWRLAIVKGTPAASPVAPALPNTAVLLAQVTIPAGSGTLGTITDKRTRALVGAGAALVNAPAPPRRLTGKITGASGAVAQGTGFTCVRNGPGDYTVTFDDAFGAAPAVSVTAIGTTSTNAVASLAASPTTTAFRTLTAAGVDKDFLFIVEEMA